MRVYPVCENDTYLWKEAQDIIEEYYYSYDHHRRYGIKNVYAICYEDEEMFSENGKITGDFQITKLERKMYRVVKVNSSNGHFELKLPPVGMLIDNHRNDYLIIVNEDEQYIIGRILNNVIYRYKGISSWTYKNLPLIFKNTMDKYFETMVEKINNSEEELIPNISINENLEKITINKNFGRELVDVTEGKYEEATIITTKRRNFESNVGINYYMQTNDINYISVQYNKNKIISVIREWTRLRIIENKIFFKIIISEPEMNIYHDTFYENNWTIKIYGDITDNNINIPDNIIKQALIELFTYTKISLKQESVIFSFNGYTDNISVSII